MEDINFSKKELYSSKKGVSIIFYMKKIFPGYYKIGFCSYILVISILIQLLAHSYFLSFFLDEWKNFLERMGCEELDVESKDDESKEELRGEESKEQLGEEESKEELREEVRNWASFRGQTLSRTGE